MQATSAPTPTAYPAAAAYDRDYFSALQVGSERSARRIAPLIVSLCEPASVVDVGCGVGAWLRAFADLGVTEVLGIDGAYLNRELLRIPPERFQAADLSRPFRCERAFDLAICMEVAEHLPEERAAGLVADLASLAPVVLFSAAVPGQGGEGHVNEQWPDYWAAIFDHQGYEAVDCVRPRIWSDPEVEYWYAQNSLLFVRRDHSARLESLSEQRGATSGPPRRLVHPSLYSHALHFRHAYSNLVEAPSLRFLLKSLPAAAKAFAAHKLS